MPIIKQLVTQGGVDTFTAGTIDTDMTADGASAWQINKIRAFWADGYTAAAGDQILSAVLSTQATATVPTDAQEIDRVVFAVSNTGGVAVAYPMDLVKEVYPSAERLTVQPNLYLHVDSTGTGLANDVYFEIEYTIIKLTNNEVLRLLIGGS